MKCLSNMQYLIKWTNLASLEIIDYVQRLNVLPGWVESPTEIFLAPCLPGEEHLKTSPF